MSRPRGSTQTLDGKNMKKELPKDIKKLIVYLLGIATFIPWVTWQLNFVDVTNVGSIFFLQVLPSFPFVILAVLASFKNSEGNPSFSKQSIIGAMVGGLIAVCVPYALLFISAHVSMGVNFGVAFLCMAMPIYLPIAMNIGWNRGKQKDAI